MGDAPRRSARILRIAAGGGDDLACRRRLLNITTEKSFMRSCNRFVRSAVLGSGFVFCTFVAGAQAHSFAVLHDFAGPPSDGSYPYNPVTFGTNGAIYGATNLGGSADSGTIFEIAADGSEMLLHSFDGAAGGSDPNAGVTLDPATGDIYGTTTFGGSNGCRNGCGVLYRLAADGTYSVLRTFDPAKDGQNPVGRLVRDGKGNLYGITTFGGPNIDGTIFRYSASGTFKVLHGFGGADGFSPQGSLLLGKKGNLYGITNQGGADNFGTVYRIAANGKGFSVLYSFTGGVDGGYPSGGLGRDSAGNLYGTTNLAGNGQDPNGTVFKLTPDGNLTTLYVFSGGTDGGYPESDILQDRGELYGTTTAGGSDGDGVVYKVDVANGGETVLHSFTGNDGANPYAGLTRYRGRLYGTAGGGGAQGYGVLFRVKK